MTSSPGYSSNSSTDTMNAIIISSGAASIISAVASTLGLYFSVARHARHTATFQALQEFLKSTGPLGGKWSPSFEGYFVYYPGHRQVPTGLCALIDMIRDRRRSATRGYEA